jgi:predicted nucleic acid-binding protein
MNSRFVLDSSVTLSWCFPDESSPETDAVLEHFDDGATALIPHLWAWEVGNVLLLAVRNKRITETQLTEKISLLQSLRLEIDPLAHHEAMATTAALAREHKLTLYDATYLEMAIRLNLPLGTLDTELRVAAKKKGVALLPAKIA